MTADWAAVSAFAAPSLRQMVERQLAAELDEEPTAGFCQEHEGEVTRRVHEALAHRVTLRHP